MSSQGSLRPSILDKLIGTTDANADAKRAGAVPCYLPRLDRFGEPELRACLMRDIAWLLNDIQLGAATDLRDFPEVETSVINHGLPDLTGKSVDRESLTVRAEEIAQAIRIYETRIDPASVVVQIDEATVLAENQVRFKLAGEIRNAYEDSRFVVVTAIDLDTGNVDVKGQV